MNSFLLTNKIGGFCLLGSRPFSRYSGVFFHSKELFKVIEDIRTKGNAKIKNNLWSAEKNGTLFMPYKYNSLVYETKKEFELLLDIKKPYDNRVWGRNYSVTKEKKKIIISFVKTTSMKEDGSEGDLEFACYLVIAGKDLEILPKGEWEEQEYSLDKNRGSEPSTRYVYNAMKIKGNPVVFSFSTKKKDAANEAEYVLKNLDDLKQDQEKYVKAVASLKKIKDKDVDIAFKSAINSMDQLTTMIDDRIGIYAGLPWFFQYWNRDQLISLKSLMIYHNTEQAKKILFDLLEKIDNGNIPAGDFSTTLGSADSIGWLFKRIGDLIDCTKLTKKELKSITVKLGKTIDTLRKLSQGLVYNNDLETWMDTEHGNDTRAGFRIEIQALRLYMYRLMHKLSGKKKYKEYENHLKKEVKQRFWNGSYLNDGVDDKTVRSNLFIAAYVYPWLLTKKEWRKCFKSVLPKLWCKWGGLATIDKNNQLFTSEYTGENNKSYHRGDSWYWLNNMAAIVMHRVDKEVFKRPVDAILKASTKEILYSGVIGSAAEVSSAKEMRSEGCLSQAWSNAMYVEMVWEMF